jgi:hypothetical protein
VDHIQADPHSFAMMGAHGGGYRRSGAVLPWRRGQLLHPPPQGARAGSAAGVGELVGG